MAKLALEPADGRRREEVADLMIATVDAVAPNFRRSVLGRQILSPLDLERTFGLVGGDIFHGAFAYGLVRSWPLAEILEFACAAAALNCEGHGARGGIATLVEIDRLRRRGERSERAYSESELAAAAEANLAVSLGRHA